MDYISIKDAAKKLNVSDRYIRRLCSQGEIPGASKLAGTWIVPANFSVNLNKTINIVLGGAHSEGLEIALYLLELGEKVCIIDAYQKNVDKAKARIPEDCLKNCKIYCVDASNEEQLKTVFNDLNGLTISKMFIADFNASFDYAENTTKETIMYNFRAPIYGTILSTAIFYPLMKNTTIVALLRTKASTIGLPNETVWTAVNHGLDGYLESLIEAVKKDEKNINVLRVYSGSTDNEFWRSEKSKKVFADTSKNRIPVDNLAKIMVDTANNQNGQLVSKIFVERVK